MGFALPSLAGRCASSRTVALVTCLAFSSTALAQPSSSGSPPPAGPEGGEAPRARPPASPAPPGHPPPGWAQPRPGYPPGYPPPGYPPPGWAQPPPGYPPGYPPPGWAQPGYPPGYPGLPPGFIAPGHPTVASMDPENPPPGYHTETRARSGLVVAGGLMLGIPYVLGAAGAGAALADHNDDLVPLFIPVVGPFVTLSTAGTFERAHDAAEQAGNVFAGIGLIVDGALQVAGFTVLVVGLAARKKVVVRDAPTEPAHPAAPVVSIGPRGASASWAF